MPLVLGLRVDAVANRMGDRDMVNKLVIVLIIALMEITRCIASDTSYARLSGSSSFPLC